MVTTLASVLVVLLAQAAQPELFQLELLPQWKLMVVDGAKVGCYDESGVRELKKIDIRFKSSLEELSLVRSINTDLSAALKIRTDMNVLSQNNIEIFKDLLADKNTSMKLCGEKLGECQSQLPAADIVLPVVLGGIAVVVIAFVAGYFIGDYYGD